MFDEVTARIARPCMNLAAAEHFYVEGLGFEVLFHAIGDGPDEHDLLIVGAPGAQWHLELVGGANLTASPSPTSEDLLVLYLGAPIDPDLITRLQEKGGVVVSQSSYWDRSSVTIQDPDGYRLVLTTRTWR